MPAIGLLVLVQYQFELNVANIGGVNSLASGLNVFLIQPEPGVAILIIGYDVFFAILSQQLCNGLLLFAEHGVDLANALRGLILSILAQLVKIEGIVGVVFFHVKQQNCSYKVIASSCDRIRLNFYQLNHIKPKPKSKHPKINVHFLPIPCYQIKRGNIFDRSEFEKQKPMLPTLIKQTSAKISSVPIENIQDENVIITGVEEKEASPQLKILSKKQPIYVIEDSKPPTVFPPNQTYTKLPSTVEFSRIVANVITSLSTSYFKQIESKNEKKADSTIEKWTRYLNLEQNKALVSDCFWLAICKFFRQDQYPNSEKQLEKRIADNYIGLFLSIEDKHQNQLFFKEYFNVLSQSVFYSFFYAYPKSRSKFNNKLKDDLLSMYSKLFTGVQISNTKSYYEKWTLDLGTGNILARKPKTSEEQENKSDPNKKAKISFNSSVFERTKKRETLPIRYSPIVELYLRNHKYKTRNYVSQFKMKYSQTDKNDKVKEEKFAQYRNEATRILEWSQAQKEEEEAKRIQLQSEIKAIKRETINHHKRLDRRKAEELERGAHEYANYLVSMLNAGITMTSLGVIRKNVS